MSKAVASEVVRSQLADAGFAFCSSLLGGLASFVKTVATTATAFGGRGWQASKQPLNLRPVICEAGCLARGKKNGKG